MYATKNKNKTNQSSLDRQRNQLLLICFKRNQLKKIQQEHEMSSSINELLGTLVEENKEGSNAFRSLTLSYRLSIRREKFWRYSFNMNLPKMNEYADKTCQSFSQILDQQMFHDGKGEYSVVCVPPSFEDEEDLAMLENESGMLRFADEMKSFGEIASNYIEFVSDCIEHNMK